MSEQVKFEASSTRRWMKQKIAFVLLGLVVALVSVVTLPSENPDGTWRNQYFVKFANNSYGDLVINGNRYYLEQMEMGTINKSGFRKYNLKEGGSAVFRIWILGRIGLVSSVGPEKKWGLLVKRHKFPDK